MGQNFEATLPMFRQAGSWRPSRAEIRDPPPDMLAIEPERERSRFPKCRRTVPIEATELVLGPKYIDRMRSSRRVSAHGSNVCQMFSDCSVWCRHSASAARQLLLKRGRSGGDTRHVVHGIQSGAMPPRAWCNVLGSRSRGETTSEGRGAAGGRNALGQSGWPSIARDARVMWRWGGVMG